MRSKKEAIEATRAHMEPKLPKPPKGYTHWEYKGEGYSSGNKKVWIVYTLVDRRPTLCSFGGPVFSTANGIKDLLYWEAVKVPEGSNIPIYEI